MLLISSETDSRIHGKGWGALHEITDQRAVTAPMTSLSLRAYRPEDVPEMMARAFTSFKTSRPRPVHLSIPIDVLAMPVEEEWTPVNLPEIPLPRQEQIQEAAEILRKPKIPSSWSEEGRLRRQIHSCKLMEQLSAPIISSTAGKGIVPDDHPLSLNASIIRPEVQEYLSGADVILAVGTELAETDSFVDFLKISGKLIRIDLDPSKINDQYPADLGIISDAKDAVEMILKEGNFSNSRARVSLEKELES